MNNLEIDAACFSDPYLGSLFRGTNPMDQLPPCEDGAYVFNLSNSKSEGTHWVTVYIVHSSLDYMDSYGRNAPAILKRWGKKCSWNENPYSLQSPFTAVCGQYCIYFLTQRARDIPFQILLGNFSNNVDINDRLVYDYVQDKFGLVKPPFVDTKGIVRQVARALVHLRRWHWIDNTSLYFIGSYFIMELLRNIYVCELKNSCLDQAIAKLCTGCMDNHPSVHQHDVG